MFFFLPYSKYYSYDLLCTFKKFNGQVSFKTSPVLWVLACFKQRHQQFKLAGGLGGSLHLLLRFTALIDTPTNPPAIPMLSPVVPTSMHGPNSYSCHFLTRFTQPHGCTYVTPWKCGRRDSTRGEYKWTFWCIHPRQNGING